MTTVTSYDLALLYAVPGPPTKHRFALRLALRTAAKRTFDLAVALPRAALGWVLRHLRTIAAAAADVRGLCRLAGLGKSALATPAGPHRSRDAGPSGQPRPAHPPSPGPAHPGHLARDPARNGARPVRGRPVPGTASRQRPSLPRVSRTPPTRSADRKEPEQPASTGRPRPRPASQPRLQQWMSSRTRGKSMTLSRSTVPNAAPSSAAKQTIHQPSLTVLTIGDRPSAAHPGGPPRAPGQPGLRGAQPARGAQADQSWGTVLRRVCSAPFAGRDVGPYHQCPGC